MRRSWNILAGLVLSTTTVASAAIFDAHFDNLYLPGTNTFWNGSDLSGGFKLQNVTFPNGYNPSWFSWWGMGYSNIDDTNTPGWGNQYAAYSGTDLSGTGIYAVVFDDAWSPERDIVELPVEGMFEGFYINNDTYTAISMRDGDGFAKKFGGATGDDPDWFLLTITAKDGTGSLIDTQEFYLADFRFTNNAQDYIISDWTWVSLSNFGSRVKTIHFDMTSSDVGDFGMNTPSYFVMDGLQSSFSYDPPAGQSGSFGVNMNSTSILAWASGWTNYLVGPESDPTWQTPNLATGAAAGTAFDIVCLGRGGEITMTFDTPIANGPGADFAVFENGLSDGFLELGWVEVSSDGQNFFRFENHSLTPSNVAPFAEIEATNLFGFASKYRQGFGTPFDLDALQSPAGLNAMEIRYVRIIDIVGDGSQTDSFGNVIFDPYPTVESAGIDLDAIGSFYTAHKIETAADDGGYVSPDGTSYAIQGLDFAISITPDPYWAIDEVEADGQIVASASLYTFTNVQAPHTLDAFFSQLTTSNGIPQSWLASYGITSNFDALAQTDDDNDTFTAEQEYYIGSGPDDPTQAFLAANVIPADGSNCLQWISGTNGPQVSFSVEGCAGSFGGSWTQLVTAIQRDLSGTNAWYHSITNEAPWFYRVKLTP